MSSKWKKTTFSGNSYYVYEEHFPGVICYSAWEPGAPAETLSPFIKKYSHRRLTDVHGGHWGAIDERELPRDIKGMTPQTVDRIAKEGLYELAVAVIKSALSSFGYSTDIESSPSYCVDKGRVLIKTTKPPDKEEKTPVSQNDQIKSLLAVADMPRLVNLANLNGVVYKASDTPGLLKMRLSNALRATLKKGGTIKTQ